MGLATGQRVNELNARGLVMGEWIGWLWVNGLMRGAWLWVNGSKPAIQ